MVTGRRGNVVMAVAFEAIWFAVSLVLITTGCCLYSVPLGLSVCGVIMLAAQFMGRGSKKDKET